MTVFHSRIAIFISHTVIFKSHVVIFQSRTVISQSHTSITETRYVIFNSTHFCHAWLAIATGNQLSSLSSEVLRLRLQALNLSVRDSRQQLITRLKSALKSQTTRTGRAMPIRPRRSTRRKEHSNAASATTQPTALNSEHESDSDGNSSSMDDGSSSLDDLLSLQERSALPPAGSSVPSPADTPFSDASCVCYNKRCKRPWRTLVSSRNMSTSITIPRLQFAPRVWLCLLVYNGLSTALWRRKSCGVSTLILHCSCQTR